MEAQAFAALLQLLEVALIDCAPAFAALASADASRSIALAVLRSLVHTLAGLRAAADAPVQQVAATATDLLAAFQTRKWFEPDARARQELLTQVVDIIGDKSVLAELVAKIE